MKPNNGPLGPTREEWRRGMNKGLSRMVKGENHWNGCMRLFPMPVGTLDRPVCAQLQPIPELRDWFQRTCEEYL